MSDTTSLSSNYSVTAAFAKEFNGAVLVLKRRHLAQESTPAPAADEVAEARKKLAEHLRSVIFQLVPDEPRAEPAPERIPDGVISRLAEKHQNKMAWFVSDLRQAERSLSEAAALSQDDFAALDEVCDAADATASASFRRLWRR
jgi:hypothetical protein